MRGKNVRTQDTRKPVHSPSKKKPLLHHQSGMYTSLRFSPLCISSFAFDTDECDEDVSSNGQTVRRDVDQPGI